MIRDDFTILGIAPTDDLTAIKRAYAGKVKQCHPEEDPLGWQRLHDAYLNATDYAKGVRKDFGESTTRQNDTEEKESTGRPGEYDELFRDLSSTVSEKSEQKDRIIMMLKSLPGQCVRFRREQVSKGLKDPSRVEKRVQVWCACKLRFLFGSEDYKRYRLDQEVFGALILMSESLNVYGKYTVSILKEELQDIAETAEGIGRTDIFRTAREVRNNLQIHDYEQNKPVEKPGMSDNLAELIGRIIAIVPVVIFIIIALEEEDFTILFVGSAVMLLGIFLFVCILHMLSKNKKYRESGIEAEDAACIRKALSAEERSFIERNEPTIEMMVKSVEKK